MRHILPLAALALLPTSLSAQNYYELDANNIRARFYSHGLIGMNFATGEPEFEVPNGGGAHPLFSAGLWIGGMDIGNSLRLAAMSYEPLGSSDYYPGPLTVDGTASTTTAVQAAYDQVWPIDNAAVLLQQQYCACLDDPNCDEAVEFPGYQMPLWFNTWPAIGDFQNGFAQYQAPFFDHNNNGDYDPTGCDRPCTPGDEALFFIFNDKGGTHQNSQGQPIGVEVQAMPFAYGGADPALDNTVFVEYKIINRGVVGLTDAYISLFTDFDLGCANDDYVGCDVGRSMWYVYNGTANDAGAACVGGAQGYGTEPPAFAATILCGVRQDQDALDNPFVADHAQATAQLGSMYPDWGVGFGDNIVDNERMGLCRFSYYDNSSTNTGNPLLANQYYNSMRGFWNDGSALTYGGNGYGGAIPARFAFPDDSDPLGQGTNGSVQPPWSEVGAGNAPFDRRGVGTMGPITLEPGDEQRILVAFTYARSSGGGAMSSVGALKARVDSVRAFAMAHDFCSGATCLNGSVLSVNDAVAEVAPIILGPVPTNGTLTVTLPTELRGATLHIVDAVGRTVMTTTGTTSAQRILDVASLADGHYTLIAQLDGTSRHARFVKE